MSCNAICCGSLGDEMKWGKWIVVFSVASILVGCGWLKSPQAPKGAVPEATPEPTPDPSKIVLDFHYYYNDPISYYSIDTNGEHSESFEKISTHKLSILKPENGEKLIFFVWFGSGFYHAQMILEKSPDCPPETPFLLRMSAGYSDSACGPSEKGTEFTISGNYDAIYFKF
jgi:hypothetical protein